MHLIYASDAMTFEIVFVPHATSEKTKVFHIAAGWMCGIGLYDILRVWLDLAEKGDSFLRAKYQKLMTILYSWNKVAEQPGMLSKMDPLAETPLTSILQALCQSLKGHFTYQQWYHLDSRSIGLLGFEATRNGDFWLANETTQILDVVDALPWLVPNTSVQGETAQTIIPVGVFSYMDLVNIIKELLVIGQFINGDDESSIEEDELFAYIGREGINMRTAPRQRATNFNFGSGCERIHFEFIMQKWRSDTTYRVISSLN